MATLWAPTPSYARPDFGIRLQLLAQPPAIGERRKHITTSVFSLWQR